MAKNIQINIKTSSGYEILYPQTTSSNITDLSTNYYNKTQLANAVTYTGSTTNVTVGSLSNGTIFSYGNEILLKIADNYQGTGNTLVCIKRMRQVQWNSDTTYATSGINSGLTDYYNNDISTTFKNIIKSINIQVYSGVTTSTSVTTLAVKIFLLSVSELKQNSGFQDGTYIPNALNYMINRFGMSGIYTRTSKDRSSGYTIDGSQTLDTVQKYNQTFYTNPCCVIPSTTVINTNYILNFNTISGTKVNALKIHSGNYFGTGATNITLAYPKKPFVIFLQGQYGEMDYRNYPDETISCSIIQDCVTTTGTTTSSSFMIYLSNFNWGNTSVSFQDSKMCFNSKDCYYEYYMLYYDD